MQYFDWDTEKNALLKNKRGVSFEDVEDAFYNERILDDINHPNPSRYPNQRIMVVNIDNYAYLVPYIEEGEKVLAKQFILKYLKPFLHKKLDAVALGCTHYPFYKSEIKKILGPKIKVISQDEIIPKKLKNYFGL